MKFHEFFKIFTEELTFDRIRKVRKGFQRKHKFKPGTFGFDIEFDYKEHVDMEDHIDEWIAFIRSDHGSNHREGYRSKFNTWLLEHEDRPLYDNLEDFDDDNPEPDAPSGVRPVEPQRKSFKTAEEYDSAFDVWQSINAEWDAYDYDYEEWSENRDRVEYDISDWENRQKELLKEYALETINDAYEYIKIPSTDAKKDEYQGILEDLGEDAEQYDGNSDKFDFVNQWAITTDGSDGSPPEIASRILTTKDFPVVRALLQELQNEETSGGTSAHIHVGMPENFDTFSVLSLYNLVDEDYIEKTLPGRQFDQFAKLTFTYKGILNVEIKSLIQGRNKLYKVIKDGKTLVWPKNRIDQENIETFTIEVNEDESWIENDTAAYFKLHEKDFDIINEYPYKTETDGKYWIEYTVEWHMGKRPDLNITPITINHLSEHVIEFGEDVMDYLASTIREKMSGINISYFKKRNTIEFRYLSSEILSNINGFFKFINYFLFIPHIAAKAKRINLKSVQLLKSSDGRYRAKRLS